MKKKDLVELHYITHIANVKSIIEKGILSHNLAHSNGIKHYSVAMNEVQCRRRNRVVPGGKRLHDYVNLYICARNPMLFKIKHLHKELCILRIEPSALDIVGTVISTGNAASDYIAFYPGDRGLEMLDKERVFAEYWTDTDPIIKLQKTTAKCAEALIPEMISSTLIFGAYVSCNEVKQHLNLLVANLQIDLHPNLFFIK